MVGVHKADFEEIKMEEKGSRTEFFVNVGTEDSPRWEKVGKIEIGNFTFPPKKLWIFEKIKRLILKLIRGV